VLRVSDRGPELRAPTRDGAVLAVPPLERAGDLLAANRRRFAAAPPVLGRPLTELRAEARRAALAAARRHLHDRGEPAPDAADAPYLIAAGHQPELFHPGVWVKNFALHGLARRHGAAALNLVVDSDTLKSTALRVPSPPNDAVGWPHTVTVPFDRWVGEIPYEERTIADRATFASFAERAGAVVRGWGYEPLLTAFWPDVLREAERNPHVGECFAAARRAWERRWGCHNLELPASVLGATEPYTRFACHLLSELPRFHAIYNDSVHAYRRRYDIRSKNHPVPDLAADGGWLEAPFWAWRSGAARRGRLFARRAAGRIELRTGDGPLPALPADERRSPTCELRALEAAGWKVRSRALTTTIYARVFLSDLFVHGIGGGKYDELTDEIVRRFYGCEPPAYMVLSATRWLPLPNYATDDNCSRRLAHEARDLHWNPQRHLDAAASADPAVRAAVREREAWLARTPADKAGRRERFRALREAAARIRIPLDGREDELRLELETCRRQLEANAVVRRRDYSFVLYPEDVLRPFCTQFL
jgi:hypothetical protein